MQEIGEHQDELALAQRAHVDQGFPEPLARVPLDDQGLGNVILRDDATPDQKFSKWFTRRCRASRRLDVSEV